jgi:hypothetical protein
METGPCEGKRIINRSVKFYNLDVIRSVGYRVSSKCGTAFRKCYFKVRKQWNLPFVFSAHRNEITVSMKLESGSVYPSLIIRTYLAV